MQNPFPPAKLWVINGTKMRQVIQIYLDSFLISHMNVLYLARFRLLDGVKDESLNTGLSISCTKPSRQ